MLCSALALAYGAPLWAQYGAQFGAQYVPPGTPMLFRDRPSKSAFEENVKNAPWKLGDLRLSPWLGLRDGSLVRAVDGFGSTTGDDYTLTFGAGLRGYLPVGSKGVLAAHALPEYVWWGDNENKRSLNGRYGLGMFVFFNRMTIELSHRRLQQQGYFSSEIQDLTTSRNDLSTFGIDVEIASNLFLFGAASQTELRNQEEESAVFSTLDRTEESAMVGLRFENPRGWSLELKHEDRTNDFDSGARGLSNSGTSQIATLGLDRNRIGLRLTVAANDLEADEGSDFGTFDDTTGSLDVYWQPHTRIALLGYARRSQSYSVDERYSRILAERKGARINFDIDRATLALFGEVGEDDYATRSSDFADRVDDVTAYGAELQVQLNELSFRVRAARTDYDSEFDVSDREVSSLSFAVDLAMISEFTSRIVGKLTDKLTFGNAESDW